MRTRCVGHACLEIETLGLRIVTDPWWAGPAYTNQWYPWPTPRPAGLPTRSIDYLYLSHGHADHLHPATLRTLRRGATALVPELLSGGMREYVRSLGFDRVVELKHGKTVELRSGVKATCYINLTDSLLVLDDGARVLVDANDALHASPPAVIEHFCRVLNERHPRIDTLFLGYGGASWFPNCIRLPGKDDRAQARTREELFVSSFLKIVDRLRPQLACAFAASFVLTEPHNRWINDVKLELPGPDVEHALQLTPRRTRCHLLLPDDVIEDGTVTPGGCPRPTRRELEQSMRAELKEPCERAERLTPLTEAKLRDLVRRLDARLSSSRGRVGLLEPFAIDVVLRENPGAPIRVEVDARGARAHLGLARAPMKLELRAEILEAALAEEYGTESIVIGYGAVAWLERPTDLARVQALLEMLRSRRGSWRAVLDDLREDPWRAADELWRQRWPLAFHLGTKLGVVPHRYEPKQLGAATPPNPPARTTAEVTRAAG